MTFQGQLKRLCKYRANKRPMSPFLEVGFEKFFDSHMQEYIGKLKMTKLNRFDTDCKNERTIFTRCISFTGHLAQARLFRV